MNEQEQTPLPADAMTTGQAAKMIGVATQTVYTWAKSGKIRGWWVGERIIVSRADVLAMVQPLKPEVSDAPRTAAERARATAEAIRRFNERRAGRRKRPKGTGGESEACSPPVRADN